LESGKNRKQDSTSLPRAGDDRQEQGLVVRVVVIVVLSELIAVSERLGFGDLEAARTTESSRRQREEDEGQLCAPWRKAKEKRNRGR
jgi:hypothetical protein